MAPTSSVAGKARPSRSFVGALEAFFSLQRESAAMRFIARGVLTTWLLPLFFALFAALQTPAAQAQGAPAQSVIVLDFATGTGLDPLYGRKAADGLAVELQRSGSYDVVPRQRIEQAVDQQAGLQPPYNNTAQIKLAETVNASSVFSGTITGVAVNPGKSARVTLQVSQLDVITGDPINGTVVSESTEQKLGTVDNEILIDEAINKAVFAAVRSMRQTTLPSGTILNVGTDEFVISLGASGGASVGQKYTILRDKYDAARNVTERRKIGEATITRVNSGTSNARLSAGGAEGVATNDRVRQIFQATSYPVTATRNGNSVTPVTGPPVRANGGNRAGGFLKKSSAGIIGLVGLAALVGLAGFGGGNGTSPPRPLDITEANPTQVYPQPRFSFNAGFNGIGLSQTLDRESVVAYLIYRGTAPNFTPDVTNLQAVVDARFDASNKTVTFTDAGVQGFVVRRNVTITATQTAGGNNNNGGTTTGANASGTDGINFSNTEVTTVIGDSFVSNSNQITIQFTQKRLLIGQPYYYRVGRITANRQRTTVTGNNNANNNTTQVILLPVRSPISDSLGGYTPLFLPQIVDETAGNPNFRYDTDNFSLLIGFDNSAFPVAQDFFGNVFINGTGAVNGYQVPNQVYVGSGVNQFRFEVSTSQAFPRNATFISPDIPNPGFDGQLNAIRLSLGSGSNIRIPSSPQNPYVPGVTTLYARVLSRNTADSNPTFRISPTLVIRSAVGLDRTAKGSRFLPAPGGSSTDGINLNRPGSGLSRSGGTDATRVRVPR